ncbi:MULTISPECIES: phytanoyl-CoA dioxygenase family protein [Cobetia]|uniref:HalD/BesD family halogenase n=1 Tax=Cobetia TaxID=204286 RepID=UPI0026933745|nr:phytanoyl-CoA dioxygenase family protein [Cobetia amphilecti]
MTDLTSAMPPQLADAETVDLSALVDTERYPLHDPRSPALEATIAKAREDLEREGCAVLRGFLRPERLAQMQAETARLAETAFYNTREVNAYFTADDDRLPQQDPRRLFMTRTSGFVTRDMIPADSLMQRLYVSQAMKQLVSACLGRERVYEYADPFAGLVLNVLPDGTEQPWHYDTNEFIVTMMTQQPESGGQFEYCPGIRTPNDEHYAAVGEVIRGESREAVKTLSLNPGDLQLFKGRFSLHRVTQVSGVVPRLTAIFAYSETPGVVGRLERTRQLYGRVSEQHILAEAQHVQRADGLLD